MKRILFLVVAFALCMSTMSQIRMHIWKDGKSRDYVVYDVDNMIPNVDSVTFSGVVKAEDTPVATSPATPSTTQSATPKEIPTTELYKETEQDSLSLFILENFLQIQILYYTDNQ